MDKGQMSLDLEIPKKVTKKQKGYYIPVAMIQFIKDEAERLGCSQNDIFTALVVQYQDSIGYKAEDDDV